jgi:hypothetical protein
MRIKSFLSSNLETRGDLDGKLSCGLFFKLFIKQYPWFLINANPYKSVKSPYYKYPPRLHCPWCGTHVSTGIDFDKSIHAGQYRSKEDWER